MFTLMAVTLTLALANRDREIAADQALAMAKTAADRAWERDLVLGSLAEGVSLFADDGRIVLQNEVGRQLFKNGTHDGLGRLQPRSRRPTHHLVSGSHKHVQGSSLPAVPIRGARRGSTRSAGTMSSGDGGRW